MAEETTISMAGINAPPLYRLVEDGGKTVIMTADTNTPMWVINGDIAGGAKPMTTAERTAITPEAGQLIYDTDDGNLYVGDGYTPGGVVVSGGGGGTVTKATVSDIMTGSGAAKVLDVSNIRGALTAGQAVDVTSQPDGVTGDYKGTFTVTGSLGFASFPKYAAGLNYLMIADLTATTNGTVTPSGTWLDGTATAKSLEAGTSTRVAMLFNAANKALLTFASTGSVSVSNCREYEVTACSNEAIAYIAALSNPDSFQDYYLVRRDMVSPWTNIIDMGESPATTVAAGLAYQIKAMTGSHIITVDTCPEGYVGRETFVRIFVGQTGNVVVQSPLQLGTPLIANAINNCTISYRDGTAVLTVDDTVGGYIVDAASGTTAGTLYYGLMDSATEFISIPGAFDGIPVAIGGASVTTSGTAQKYVVGNGISSTFISGNLNAGAGKLNLSNLALSDVGITGGTLTLFNGAAIGSGTTVLSSGAFTFDGGGIGNGGTFVNSGGSLYVNRINGTGGTLNLGGKRVYLSSGTTVHVSGCTVTGGSASTGGAFVVTAGATLYVYNCYVSGNSASYGGGLEVTGSDALAIVSGSTITDNTNNYGDITVQYGGKVRLRDSVVRYFGIVNTGNAVEIDGSCTITTSMKAVTGTARATVTISSGASINLTSSINPGGTGGITVLTGGCMVNGATIAAGTYSTITSSGGSAVAS